MLSVKILGIILITFSCAFTGFCKAWSLTLRHKKLSLVFDGICMLNGYIQSGGCELDTAIKNSFLKCDFLSFDREFYCDDKDLKKEEKDLLFEFFGTLGKSAKKAECEKIENLKIKLQQILLTAQNDVKQKSKIYQSFGICVGLAIGILLI